MFAPSDDNYLPYDTTAKRRRKMVMLHEGLIGNQALAEDTAIHLRNWALATKYNDELTVYDYITDHVMAKGEAFNPVTNQWIHGGTKERVDRYKSPLMILPDGSVLWHHNDVWIQLREWSKSKLYQEGLTVYDYIRGQVKNRFRFDSTSQSWEKCPPQLRLERYGLMPY